MTMYQFKRHTLDWLNVFVAKAKKRDTHLKMFASPVSPLKQPTLNIYAEGEFSITVGGFRQHLQAGESNLNLSIKEIPSGVLVVERVLSEESLRFCVSPVHPETPWKAAARHLEAGEVVEAEDGFVLPLLADVQPRTSYGVTHAQTVYLIERIT